MAWDFSTDPTFQQQLDWVAQFCEEEIEPIDLLFPGAAKSRDPKMQALVDPLEQEVKSRGLRALLLDEQLGGPGLGQLELALLKILAAHGTPEQRERWLYPLMNQEIWSAFSMTEPQGGSDPTPFETTAVRDGDDWVISGEKWFTSFGQDADIILVMCQNNVLRGYEPHEGNWPTEFLPEKRADLLADDAELASSVAQLERRQCGMSW